MKYQIRIYDEYEKYGGYDDGIYYPNRDKEDVDCLVYLETASTKKEIIKIWNKLIKKYEGWTYCIREDGDVIVGGIFDPNDIEILEEI